MLSDGNARLAAARRLTRRAARSETGRFLAEGTPAVTAALGRPGVVLELFGTASALRRHADLLAGFDGPVDEISDKAAAELSETVTPQGIVAVCRRIDVSLADVLAPGPRLVAALVNVRDPGNLGTIVRTADAAGADAVVVAGDSVDIYNGKTVRATAGSLFHLGVATGVAPGALLSTPLPAYATTGAGDTDLDDLIDSGVLRAPALWLFGSEAHGLPAQMITHADRAVRVPIRGRAESLNLAAAAAICLYASARAQRSQ